jgi:hypothetical protein
MLLCVMRTALPIEPENASTLPRMSQSRTVVLKRGASG